MSAILVAIHTASIAGLALYGLFGFLTLWLFLRLRNITPTPLALTPDELPVVTVQLPIYNEREVVQRLINAVAAFDFPRERLEIQVLDDSTDDTTDIAAERVSFYRDGGVNITLHHRPNRDGFKAGALEESMGFAQGEFIAIFDADFVPPPDFLRRLLPILISNPDIGALQARWGHLNLSDSKLTGAQAIALDKHFAIEQVVRHRANFFPKFNGSAGIWRRACIEEAGGWQADTACEDLCLSTRAVLAGWHFHFADDFTVPAELPSTVMGYKLQQARWAMGATQCLVKYARQIWHAKQHSPIARAYALLSMTAYTTHALFLALLLVQLPLLVAGGKPPSWLFALSILGLGQPILFAIAQREIYPDWVSRLRNLPALLLVAIGLAPSNTWAVIQGLSSKNFTFSRTPKGAQNSYRLSLGRMLIAEGLLLSYSFVALTVALAKGAVGPVFLLLSSILGFAYVLGSSLREANLHAPKKFL